MKNLPFDEEICLTSRPKNRKTDRTDKFFYICQLCQSFVSNPADIDRIYSVIAAEAAGSECIRSGSVRCEILQTGQEFRNLPLSSAFRLSDLTAAFDDIFIGHQLTDTHRASCMKLLGGNADFCTQSHFTAVGEAGGCIVINCGCIY